MEDEFDDLEKYEKELEAEGGRSEEEGLERPSEEDFGDLEDLSKMMGVKPKAAAVMSSLDKISLCSMCTLCEIPADCFEGKCGSFAVLDVFKRDPEKDAQTLTAAFGGLEVILIVNRDQSLFARVYKAGKQKEKITPPVALFEFSELRNYLVGIDGFSELKEKGTSINSLSITKEEALTLLKQIFRN